MVKRKPIHTTEELSKIKRTYFQNLEKATVDPRQKIAWCGSTGPAELLLALDFNVFYPENHTTILGASRTANKYIPVAVAQGYSPEICSYLTSDIGAFLTNETPLTQAYGIERVPKPDVLVYNTNQCGEIQNWFAFYARKFNVPLLGIYSPKMIDKVDQGHIRPVEDQLKAIVEPLEKISDQHFEKKRLETIVRLSRKTSDLWARVLKTATTIPSPFSFFDACIHMFPAVVLRGKQVAIDYYRKLAQELEERIENQVAAVDNETYRLYWEGMPIWGKLRALSEQFIGLQTCVVASTYCNSWIYSDFNPHQPFSSMAKAYTKLFANHSEFYKEKYLQQMIRQYKIGGIIFHNARTCPHNSNTRYGMPKRIEKEIDIPILVIDADFNDLNVYSEEQTKTAITAFIEQLSGI